MPPKPWETTSSLSKSTIDTNDIVSGSAMNNLNGLNKTDSLGLGLDSASALRNSSLSPGTSALDTGYNSNSTYSPYSSGYGSTGYGMSGYGSGYGGSYGGYGGGYGSSMYGGGYGSSMYGGGYGGMYGSRYGRTGMGMGMGPDGKGNFMEFALRYLDSFSYGVQSLCEMTRNIEMNAEGLHRFWHSISNLFVRLFSWVTGSGRFCKEMFQKVTSKLTQIFSNKAFLSGLLLSNKVPKMKLYSVVLRICLIVLAVTFIAPLAKLGKGKV